MDAAQLRSNACLNKSITALAGVHEHIARIANTGEVTNADDVLLMMACVNHVNVILHQRWAEISELEKGSGDES